MHEQPPSGCTRTPEAAGAPPPGFISGSPLARQHGPSHAGLLRGRVARATERTFVRARSSHALPTAAPTPLAPNGCADGGGRSSPSPGALRQQSQRPRFSPAVRRLSHLILARLGTVFRAPREGPDPALQPGRQTAAPADGRGARGRLQPLGAGPPGGFPQRVGWDRCASHPRRPAGLGCGKLPKGQCRSEGWALAGGQEGFRRR